MDAHMFFNHAVISRPKRKNRTEKMLEWVFKGTAVNCHLSMEGHLKLI